MLFVSIALLIIIYHIFTPKHDFSLIQESLPAEDLWGTYRGNLYFGTRTRTPESLLTGLMWFGVDNFRGESSIRHACEIGDSLGSWGWVEHDGRTFGREKINDPRNNVEIEVRFEKVMGEKGEWYARISGKPIVEEWPMRLSIIYYAGYNGDGRALNISQDDDMVNQRPCTNNLIFID